MTKGWDWVIGTGLYVAALVLTWLTLFSLERFGATEVRSWAPLIQAVLSAAAIFSAWWLQSTKRSQDREAESRYRQIAIIAYSGHAEWVAAHIVDLRLHATITRADAVSYGRLIRDGEQLLKKVDVAHLPSPDAIKRTMDMAHSLGVLAGMLEGVGEKEISLSSFGKDAFATAYKQFYSARTRFLEDSKHTPEAWRRSPSKLAMTRPDEIKAIFEPGRPVAD